MIEAILSTLTIMGWLGIVLGILAIVNIITKTLVNIWKNNEKFDWKKMAKGIVKVLVFFISSTFVAVAFTMLPFISGMITNAFNTELISNEVLNTFSSVGVLSIVISTIVLQAKKAIKGIIELANISANSEAIIDEIKNNEEE